MTVVDIATGEVLPNSAKEWADRIRPLFDRATELVLETGRELILAKQALGHGHFERMVREELGRDPATARRYMAVADNPVLSNRARVHDIPSSLGALYELSQAPVDKLAEAIDAGDVHPETTRDQAKSLVVSWRGDGIGEGKGSRSDTYEMVVEMAKRRGGHSWVYFFPSLDEQLCKIGVSTKDPADRLRSHNSPATNWKWHSVIQGAETNEKAIHRYFEGKGLHYENEVFHLKGELAEYLEWLGSRAYAAGTPESLWDCYPYEGRFPWKEEWRGWAAEARLFDEEMQKWSPRNPLTRSAKILATIRSDSDEWFTPPIYIKAARAVMGAIDLDPATNALANLIVRAERAYTEREDGLGRTWEGRVWLNPPYGNLKDRFVEHLLDGYRAGTVSEAIMCLNSHATDTVWFQQLWEFPICFTHHRPRFIGGAKNKHADDVAPTTGIVFVYVGPHGDRFVEQFSQFGPVVLSAAPAAMSATEFRKTVLGKTDWSIA